MIAMKKTVSVLALLMCLMLLAGCGAQAFLHDVAGQLHDANAAQDAENDALHEDASDTDAEYDDADYEEAIEGDPLAGGHAEGREANGESYEDASLTDAEPASPAEAAAEEVPEAGYAALALEECVTDAEGSGGKLPRITVDCTGAAYINDDIQGSFGYLVDADYCTLAYTASKDGDILSILIVQQYDDEAAYFTPYLLDLASGEHIGGGELLSRMGVSAAEIAAAELRLMGQEFEHLYGTVGGDDTDEYKQEQYERTVSEENADTDRLWLEDGELYFVAKIYSLAGAEFMEYPMSAGYFYG